MSCPGTGSIPLSMAPDVVWQVGGEWLGVFAGCGLKHGGRAFMSLQL